MGRPRTAPTAAQLALFDADSSEAPQPPAPRPAAPKPPGPIPSGPIPPEPIPTPAAGPSSPPAEFRHPRAQREIELAGCRVGYALQRSRRRSIGFAVGADGLTVSVPRWVGIGDIDAALRAKSRWIVAKLEEQRERARRLAAARVDWRDVAIVPFLGAPVRVVLDARAAGAVLDATGGRLVLGLPPTAGPRQIGNAVQTWLQRQARRLFEERCAVWAPRVGVRMRRLSLSSAATRWGSASADGSIRLNWRLVHLPLAVVDYVVVHELSHLREMNHGPAFWGVVQSVLPEWEAARAALRLAALPVFD